MKLGSKLILVSSIPAVFASLGLGFYFAAEEASSLQAAFELRGETLARSLAEQLGVALSQSENIDQQLDAALDPLWEEENLLSVEVLNINRKLLAARQFESTSLRIEPYICKRPILAPPLPGETIRDTIGLIVVSIDPRPVEEQRTQVYRAALVMALAVGLGAVLVATLLGRLITRPLRQLSQAAKTIERGQYNVEVTPTTNDELATLSRSFNQMAKAITERDASLRKSRDALKQQASELSLLAKNLQDALRTREALEATKEALSDMIVHDLKSPLAAITSAAQLLLDTVSPDDRPFVEGMLSRTRGLLGMIQDLLTVRKMQEAGVPLLPSRFDVLETAQEVARDLTPVAKELGLKIEVSGVPAPLRADRQLMVRVLENLLSNALKYHKQSAPIQVKVQPQPGGVQVSVLDKGKGIPEKYQKSIFERFQQVLAPGASERQGTGLGLTFCRMAVEAHGGRIWVDSKDGQGACFSFWVPDQPEKEATAEGAQQDANL